MVAISVKPEIKQTLKAFNRFQTKQLPFAMAGALNDVAFEVRNEIVNRTYPRAFTVRNKRFAGVAFRVDKAKKTRLTATVFDRLKRDFLPIHVKGGTRTPATGTKLAIPVGINRTATGKISAAKRPRRLRNSFKANIKGRGPAIWQRTGGKRRPKLKLAYVLEQTVSIRKRFAADKAAERTVRKNFNRHMRSRLKRALATAK